MGERKVEPPSEAHSFPVARRNRASSSHAGPPRPRTAVVREASNPDYPPYSALAADVHIIGKVLWKLIRA